MKKNINKYLCQKEWKSIVKEIDKINLKGINKILIKGRYPNNNTFPPLYGIKPKYEYSKERIEYLCPRSNHDARRYVIPGKNEYENFISKLTDCWEDSDSKKLFPKALSIKELIKSNKKILPVSASILRGTLKEKPLTKIYHDSIDKWKRFTQRYLYEDSIHFNYLLELDVKEFYSRFYVHSITWALSGDKHKIKEVYKDRKKYKKLKCAKLENSIMDLQDRQTNGIPIGPLGSDILAEIIMCRIINNLESLITQDYVGIRFKDDIKILCKNKEDANSILDTFITELNFYDLDINGDKMSISQNFSKLPANEWQKKIITLPKIDCDFKKNPTMGEIMRLDNDLMALLIHMSELITPNEGNFWFDFKRRYSKYLIYLVKKNSKSRGRLITWLLDKLNEYPQHTGIILNIIVSLISSNDAKYLRLIREKGKQLSMKRNFDFCMIWIIYFIGERYLVKKHSNKFHKIFKELKLEVGNITNNDIKRESIKLIDFIEKNRKKFTGRKPITNFFMKSFARYDYE